MPSRSEGGRARIREHYDRRDADPRLRARHSAGWTAFFERSFERDLRSLLVDHGLLPLGERRVLEVGCGSGSQLARLIRFGADPRRVWGVDLVRRRLQAARAAAPAVHLVQADAGELPFPDDAFDVVAQFTMLSSITDAGMRSKAAREMTRVLAPTGVIVSYDFRIAWPRSPTRGVRRGELTRLFPGSFADIRSVTLAPPLMRAIAGRAPRLAEGLERIEPLRMHHLALLRPPA